MLSIRSRRARAIRSFAQGREACDREDLDLAMSCFNEAIRLDPGLDLGYFGRGFVHLKRLEFGPGVADFSEAIRLRPDGAMSYFYRSLCYEGLKKRDRERADARTAAELDPDLPMYVRTLSYESSFGREPV